MGTKRTSGGTPELLATALQSLAIVGLVGVLFFSVMTMWDAVAGEVLPAPVAVDLAAGDFVGELPAGVEIATVEAQLLADAGLGWRVTWGLVNVIPALLVGAALWILFRLLGGHSDPFTAVNVRRFQRLSVLALAFLVLSAIRGPVEMELQRSLGLDVFDAEFNFGVPLLLALVFTALAAVWRRGVDMRSEQELTI